MCLLCCVLYTSKRLSFCYLIQNIYTKNLFQFHFNFICKHFGYYMNNCRTVLVLLGHFLGQSWCRGTNMWQFVGSIPTRGNVIFYFFRSDVDAKHGVNTHCYQNSAENGERSVLTQRNIFNTRFPLPRDVCCV